MSEQLRNAKPNEKMDQTLSQTKAGGLFVDMSPTEVVETDISILDKVNEDVDNRKVEHPYTSQTLGV